MRAHPLIARLLLAATTAVLGVCALSSVSGAAMHASSADTPLPAGWELCILQGIGAPATQANVANLDEWQLAEGGSTNNTAAYNPFNTARTTDVNNTPLPTTSSSGFPAFTDWIAGCAATVATILQPNMTPVAAGLLAGNVSPPPAFLAVVDQSQWCAPSPDGTPCYADMIGAAKGNLALAVLSASSALDVYGNVRTDLHAYEQTVNTAALAQLAVSTTGQQLAAAQSILTSARGRATDAEAALRRFAVDEYVNSGLYQSSSFVVGTNTGPFGSPSQDGVVAHQYATVVAGDLLAKTQAAETAVKVAIAQRNGVQRTLQQDFAMWTSDKANEDHSLIRLVADVETLQKAGACTTAAITQPTPAATPGTSGTPGTPGTPGASTPPPSGPSATPSTTTTTVPAPTTTTSTSTTTTTTTTTPGNVNVVTPLPTTTTTTVPGATTTTTPSTTTTTTTQPGGSGSGTNAAPAPTPNPTGLQLLQGCVTALAPSASA